MSSSSSRRLAGQSPDLGVLGVLADLPDPRRRRGVRYRLVGVVAVTLTAVLAGARSYAAIGQWAAELTGE